MNLSRRERQLAIIVLAAIGLFLVDSLALTPLLDQWGELDTQRSQVLAEMAKMRQLLSERKQLNERWKEMLAAGLKNDSASAEGQLLHALRDWAKESGVSLSSVKPDYPQAKSSLKEIQVAATGTGNMACISKFLWLLQTSRFPLKVQDMQLASKIDGHNDLALQIKVSTLYLPSQAIESKNGASSKPGSTGKSDVHEAIGGAEAAGQGGASVTKTNGEHL